MKQKTVKTAKTIKKSKLTCWNVPFADRKEDLDDIESYKKNMKKLIPILLWFATRRVVKAD